MALPLHVFIIVLYLGAAAFAFFRHCERACLDRLTSATAQTQKSHLILLLKTAFLFDSLMFQYDSYIAPWPATDKATKDTL